MTAASWLPGDMGAAPPWLAALRQTARQAFTGLPGRDLEAWRYTPLAGLRADAFAPADKKPPAPALPAAEGARAVVVNGIFRPELSDLDDLPPGLTVSGLATVLERSPRQVELLLGRLSGPARQPMTALNTAHLADGLVVRAAAGLRAPPPLTILSIAVGAGTATNTGGNGAARSAVFHPRVLIVVEAGAELAIVSRHTAGPGGDCSRDDRFPGDYFLNGVAEIDLAAGARLDHLTVQQAAAGATCIQADYVAAGAGAAYHACVLQGGGAIARHEIRAHLGSPDAVCHVGGACLGRDRQVIDNTLAITHAAPGGRSAQNFRSVLAGRSRGVFHGKVLVERAADGTDAQQLGKAMLLSDRAEADARPELEIYADNVACSHGATVGAPDAEALFYLLSRGMPPPVARQMLVNGFLREPLEEIGHAVLRAAALAALDGSLAGFDFDDGWWT